MGLLAPCASGTPRAATQDASLVDAGADGGRISGRSEDAMGWKDLVELGLLVDGVMVVNVIVVAAASAVVTLWRDRARRVRPRQC